ncbi:MAG: hypothetical protein IPJ76_14985 [Flavobacteriales bacterium]|nr:MAG: hypothetical protein IPJ76_14985 [Flavobacteriales bacterium]
MDIQAIKLELVQQLVSTNDATVLAKVKRLLDPLRTKAPGSKDEHEEELITASTIFGQAAYGEDEPDISGLVLKEPEPLPVLQARLKRMIDEQQDVRVLDRMLGVLQDGSNEARWKEVLAARALRSEADFAAGRVFTQDQVEAHFKAKRAQ